MRRRTFLKHIAQSTAGMLAAGTIYGAVEATWVQVVRERIAVPGLPRAFKGARVAFLTDLHHGPWTGLAYIRAAIEHVNNLRPDLILLGGDYCHNGREFIEPCLEAAGRLNAQLGVFAVLGNHDHYNGANLTYESLWKSGIHPLVNEGTWLRKDGERLYLAGVDDLIYGQARLKPALEGLPDDGACILLSHNPDFADEVKDPRVGLILSGHTHGGQVVFPLVGAPIVPSTNGQKYLRGLIKTPQSQVYVSRGLGTVTPPVRFCCRPEINLIELC